MFVISYVSMFISYVSDNRTWTSFFLPASVSLHNFALLFLCVCDISISRVDTATFWLSWSEQVYVRQFCSHILLKGDVSAHLYVWNVLKTNFQINFNTLDHIQLDSCNSHPSPDLESEVFCVLRSRFRCIRISRVSGLELYSVSCQDRHFVLVVASFSFLDVISMSYRTAPRVVSS